MAGDENDRSERIRRLMEKFSVGNPLVDPEAYKRALEDCPDDESRELLRAIRESVEENADEFLRRLIEASEPRDAGGSDTDRASG